MINQTRLKLQLDVVSKFGALQGGGITRLAFSNEEKEARAYVTTLMKELGMSISVDAIGNIRGRLAGEQNLPAVTVGSHLDSVPFGGCFDGTLGVMCGLEALTCIKENGISHTRPLELIIFSCEESSRFNMATVGSKAMSGKLNLEKLHQLKDKDGITLYEAAKVFGCDIDNLSALPSNTFHSYLELHIEQGPVLEAKGVSVGIVTGIASPIRYELTLKGRADHSGATPMDMRKDALVGASEVILGIENIAKLGKTTVATVGYAKATPAVLNVIAGEAILGIDIRDIDKEALLEADKRICQLIDEVCAKRGLSYELKELCRDFPTTLSPSIIELLEKEANALKIESLKLPSGAGHDAMHMDSVAKNVGMIFVPCVEGISHNVAEMIDMNDVFKATEVLAKTIIALSNEI